MSKNKNALRAGFAEVKKNSKKVALIRAEKKSSKYGYFTFDYEDEEYFDPADIFEEGEESTEDDNTQEEK